MAETNKNSEFILHLTNARLDKKDAVDYLTNAYASQTREYITTHKEDDIDISVAKVFTKAFKSLHTFRGDSADFAAYIYKTIHEEITLDLLDMEDFITAEHHKALSLNIFFGLSYEQIATILDSSSSQIQQLATQATQNLINQKNRASADTVTESPQRSSDEPEEVVEESVHFTSENSVDEHIPDLNNETSEEASASKIGLTLIDENPPQGTTSGEPKSSFFTALLAEPEASLTAEVAQVEPEEEKSSAKKFLLLLSALTFTAIAGAAVAYVMWNQNRSTATGAPETSILNDSIAPTTTQQPTTQRRTTVSETSFDIPAQSQTEESATSIRTTTQKPTTSNKATTVTQPTTIVTTLQPPRPIVAPPQSCEVQLWDDSSAGVEVFEPTQNFRPNYIFYNARLTQIKETKNLEPPQRDDPQELEWIAATNGFRTEQVFYVAASDATGNSSPIACERVTR